MRYTEAKETFATARRPDQGKPLPGANVRLWDRGDDYVVTYHDSDIVRIRPDGSYILNDCGYPTRMTMQRMREYAPVQLEGVGPLYERQKYPTELPWQGYNGLALLFSCPIGDQRKRESLFYQIFPSRYRLYCTLPFPRHELHVDADGLPVLDSLLAQISPPEWASWASVLRNRLQPWEQVPRLDYQRAGAPKRQTQIYLDRWPSVTYSEPSAPPQPDLSRSTLMLLRRTWMGNRPVASVWSYIGPGESTVFYRWIAIGLGSAPDLSGESTQLDTAVDQADAALERLEWSSAPPRLTDVLGNLRTHLVGSALLDQPVLRVHWVEPWTTTQISDMARTCRLKRQPLPGSRPWPGPGEVRLWFELPRIAVGVAYNEQTRKNSVLIVGLKSGGRTEWSTPGVLATGLLGAVLALIGGLL